MRFSSSDIDAMAFFSCPLLKKFATSIRATPFSEGSRSGRLTPSGRAYAGESVPRDNDEASIAATDIFFNDDPIQSNELFSFENGDEEEEA